MNENAVQIANMCVKLFAGIPELNEVTPPEPSQQNVTDRTLVGGERRALEHMQARLLIEAEAFRKGSYRPNQVIAMFRCDGLLELASVC